MAHADEIGWGSYMNYEGPYYRGKTPFKLPSNPTESERIIAVITSTEGGKFDAYNGYDRCICTSGLLQWCEGRQYSVSDMLGWVATHDLSLLEPLIAHLRAVGVRFATNEKNRWRFFFKDVRGEVDTEPEQQQLFFLNSNGKKGTWDPASKEYARMWAAAISTVWENPAAARLQMDWTVSRLRGFLLPAAERVISSLPKDNAYARALTAAYYSFAANNPTWANNALGAAMSKVGAASMLLTPDGFRTALAALTFNPGVAIYPGRYNKIRPVLESLYGVDLPNSAEELRIAASYSAAPSSEQATPELVQKALIGLGYDIGPKGADGVLGPKSLAALMSFKQLKGLPVDERVSSDVLKALGIPS